MQKATHYYYKGSALVQEYDEFVEGDPPVPRDELLWDYLRGADGQVLRRRQRDAQGVDTDTLHFNDILGTIKEEGDPTQGGIGKIEYGHKG